MSLFLLNKQLNEKVDADSIIDMLNVMKEQQADESAENTDAMVVIEDRAVPNKKVTLQPRSKQLENSSNAESEDDECSDSGGKTSGLVVLHILHQEKMSNGRDRFRVVCEDEAILWVMTEDLRRLAPDALDKFLDENSVESAGSETNQVKRSREILMQDKRARAAKARETTKLRTHLNESNKVAKRKKATKAAGSKSLKKKGQKKKRADTVKKSAVSVKKNTRKLKKSPQKVKKSKPVKSQAGGRKKRAAEEDNHPTDSEPRSPPKKRPTRNSSSASSGKSAKAKMVRIALGEQSKRGWKFDCLFSDGKVATLTHAQAVALDPKMVQDYLAKQGPQKSARGTCTLQHNYGVMLPEKDVRYLQPGKRFYRSGCFSCYKPLIPNADDKDSQEQRKLTMRFGFFKCTNHTLCNCDTASCSDREKCGCKVVGCFKCYKDSLEEDKSGRVTRSSRK